MLERIHLTRQEIGSVVSAFYTRVRADATLGPVFEKHVTDWAFHEEKITRFWANAILYENSYSGNPMQVHRAAGNVEVDHFAIWLRLFDEVLAQKLSDPQRIQWSTLAHRIGRGPSMGLDNARRRNEAIPNLLE
ncbi:MAG: group III truncated hemoglobin [Paracoccaceae bacterium]|nr:group III truncated hemoglobin [Paracoccaceae bacterium]MDG2257358.1 group III truncated hemoglobin [Paracoccaceae bacterium]